MKEFDYLVNWVKELCDDEEKREFESALLESNSIGVWYYIWSKLKGEVKDANHPPNPRYEGFLDLCKKNPSLADDERHNCTTDACLGVNLQSVAKARYPEALHIFSFGTISNPFVVQQSNETVESESGQKMPLRNPLRDNLDDLSSKYIK